MPRSRWPANAQAYLRPSLTPVRNHLSSTPKRAIKRRKVANTTIMMILLLTLILLVVLGVQGSLTSDEQLFLRHCIQAPSLSAFRGS